MGKKKFLKKEGLARGLIFHNGQLIIKDFCSLLILDERDFSVLRSLRLGSDLSSDICGLTCDGNYIYAAIRKGELAVIDRATFDIRTQKICESSMWDIKVYNDSLIGGSVSGELLKIAKKEFAVMSLDLGKQNISSILLCGDIAYAAGQDKKLSKVDLAAWEIIMQKRNAHQKMFDCVGIYQNNVITASHPCGEISFWDKDTLELVKTVKLPLSLCGQGLIEGELLYLTSRSIKGIALIPLNEII